TVSTPHLDKERGDKAQLYRGEVINFEENGTYLITGGLGDLGLLFADWLIQKGAKNIVLVSRRDVDAEVKQRIKTLENSSAIVKVSQIDFTENPSARVRVFQVDTENSSARVIVAQIDVTDKSQLAELISTIQSSSPSSPSSPSASSASSAPSAPSAPIKGIIHAAGVLDDGVLQHLTWERFTNVLNPKYLGAWNLHTLTKDLPLDFFIMFSSAASLFGSPGQGNHVAANTFLDSLARYRQSLGLPGLSINWGVWSEIGTAAKLGIGQ
ncbi:MAG: KR domain-containing protein, partial [Cyanobacteria bacterium J06621_15]